MVWYWLGGIFARRGNAYQRISGDIAVKNTAKASRIRLALRRIAAALLSYGCLGTECSSGFGDVSPGGAPTAVMVRTRASAAARPIAAATSARMSDLPAALRHTESDEASGLWVGAP